MAAPAGPAVRVHDAVESLARSLCGHSMATALAHDPRPGLSSRNSVHDEVLALHRPWFVRAVVWRVLHAAFVLANPVLVYEYVDAACGTRTEA